TAIPAIRIPRRPMSPPPLVTTGRSVAPRHRFDPSWLGWFGRIRCGSRRTRRNGAVRASVARGDLAVWPRCRAPLRGGGRARPAPAVAQDLPPPPPAAALPPAIKTPSTKGCVGKPPRQTEDPLAPPCVASFSGDNFGATYQGVSKDEISVLFYFDGFINDIGT